MLNRGVFMRIMYSVRCICAIGWIVLRAVFRLLTSDPWLFILFVLAGVWLQMYLAGQKVEVNKGCVIRYSGRLIKRKTVIPVKSISFVATIVFFEWMPAVMKISFPYKSIYIFGYTPAQLERLMKGIITTHGK